MMNKSQEITDLPLEGIFGPFIEKFIPYFVGGAHSITQLDGESITIIKLRKKGVVPPDELMNEYKEYCKGSGLQVQYIGTMAVLHYWM